ncbi:MAG: acyl-CoA reductase [Nonlabens sp.]
MSTIAINSSLNDRVSAFAKAGQLLQQYLDSQSGDHQDKSDWTTRIEDAVHQAERLNSWFTESNLRHALEQWSLALREDNLKNWLLPYHLDNITPKKVGIITAGNIPLVGFHDVLCVILAGHQAMIKTSSNDDVLLPLLLEMAAASLPSLANSYAFIKGKLEQYDAVIATGSDNTSRYFEHYFGHVPHIIRKNRNSIAVLDGSESQEEMKALSVDVFQYFGLGCRSVSHIKVPRNYNFDQFFNGMYEQRDLIKNQKYLNNYDYNKAVYLMSEFELLDNEFLLIKEENSSYSSPIASVGYSYYETLKDVRNEIVANAAQLQCVVAGATTRNFIEEGISGLKAPQLVSYGMTQQPALDDYADGVDTLHFLISLS